MAAQPHGHSDQWRMRPLLALLVLLLPVGWQPVLAGTDRYAAVPCIGVGAANTGCLTDPAGVYYTSPEKILHVDVMSFYAGGDFPQGKYDYFATCPIAVDGAVAVATAVAGACWYLQLPLGAPYFDQFGWTAGAPASPAQTAQAIKAAASYRANYRRWSCIHARGDREYVTTQPLDYQGGTAAAFSRLKICGSPSFHEKTVITGDFGSEYAGWPVIDMSGNGFSGGLSDITIRAKGRAQTAFLSSNRQGGSINENGDYTRVTFECDSGSCIAGAMFQDCDTCNYNSDNFYNHNLAQAGIGATFGKSLPSLYGLTSTGSRAIVAIGSGTLTFGPSAPHVTGLLDGYQMILYDGAGKIVTREIAHYDCSGPDCIATLGVPAGDRLSRCSATTWPQGVTAAWHLTVPAVKSFDCLSTVNYGVTQQIFSAKSIFSGKIGAHFYGGSMIDASDSYTSVTAGGSDTFLLDGDDSGDSSTYHFACRDCYAEYYSTDTNGSYLHAKGTIAPTLVARLEFSGSIEYPAAHTAGGLFKALKAENALFGRLSIDDEGGQPRVPLLATDNGVLQSIAGNCQYCALGPLTAPSQQFGIGLPSDQPGVLAYNAAGKILGGGHSSSTLYCGGTGYLEDGTARALAPCSFAITATRLAIAKPGNMQPSLVWTIPAGVLNPARYPANVLGVDFNIPIFVNGSATRIQLCFSSLATPAICATTPSAAIASGPTGKFYIRARASLSSGDGFFTWEATSDAGTSASGAAFQSRTKLDLSVGFNLLVLESNTTANVLSSGQAGAVRQ